MRFELVSVLDPAIDPSRGTAKEMSAYVASRKMEDIRKFIEPGKKPTVFHCEEISHDLWESYVQAGASDADKCRRAFQCGVRSVDNLYDHDGRNIGTWTPSRVGGRDVMEESDLSKFPPRDREEIGMAIYMRSFLGPRTRAESQLPLTSLSVLGRMAFRPVEPSQSEPVQSSAEPLSDASEPAISSEATSCVDRSDSAMAVTATGTD